MSRRSGNEAGPPDRRKGRPARRRNAAATREEILDAAERRLAVRGPDGLRLQEIAEDVGIRHPTILHHFGSRENLVREVARRALGRLQDDLVESLASGRPAEDPRDAAALLRHVLTTLGDHGHARVLAWLLLTGHDLGTELTEHMRAIADAAHAVRGRRWQERGQGEPEYEDTLYLFTLAGFALFGEALAGPALSAVTDPAESDRFHAWLTRLLLAHLEGR